MQAVQQLFDSQGLMILYLMTFTAYCIRFLCVFINVFSRPYFQAAQYTGSERVSLLIPLRNEIANVSGLLASLRKQLYPHLEIILLDDSSTDGTYDCLEREINPDEPILLLRGKPLESGWLGKNFACHQLADAAQGDVLLFSDADVRIHPQAIPSMLREMEIKGLDLFSIFPDQVTQSWGEKLIVPLMHYILLSLLPLRLIWLARKLPSLAAANGQFIAFRRAVYDAYPFHSLLRREITEDIASFRLAKSLGYGCETLLGNELVRTRMYGSGREAFQGFSKNIFSMFGYMLPLLLVHIFLSYAIFPLMLLQGHWLLLYPLLVLGLGIRLGTAWLGKEPIWRAALSYPVFWMVFLSLSISSVWKHYTHQNIWKGRRLDA